MMKIPTEDYQILESISIQWLNWFKILRANLRILNIYGFSF